MIAILIVVLAIVLFVGGGGAYYLSRRNRPCVKFTRWLDEAGQQAVDDLAIQASQADAVGAIFIRKRADIKALVHDIVLSLEDAICDCYDRFVFEDPERYETITSDSGQQVLICMGPKLEWKTIDPIMKFATDQIVDTLNIEAIKQEMSQEQRDNFPTLLLLQDIKKAIDCVYAKIKTDYATPFDFFVFARSLDENMGDGHRAVIKDYIRSCFTEQPICTTNRTAHEAWIVSAANDAELTATYAQFCDGNYNLVDQRDCRWENVYGECSVECGGGTRTVTPEILVEPRAGGRPCPAPSTEPCNTHDCGTPVPSPV